MTHLLTHCGELLHGVITWLQSHDLLPGRGVMPAGFIFVIWTVLSAIFTVITTIVSFVVEAGQLVFNSILDLASFAAKGVVWLAGTIRDGFMALVNGFQSIFNTIQNALATLWGKVTAFFNAVRDFLQPVTDFLKKVSDIYNHYWKEFVQPVLTTISRIRLALGIFKYFGLKWAQDVDAWLAEVQQQIVKNTLMIHQWLTTITNWVNAVSDPYGFLKVYPVLGGLINGIDNFWLAITGTRFFGDVGRAGSAGATARMKDILAAQVSQIATKSGDAGDVITRGPTMRGALYNELGVSQP